MPVIWDASGADTSKEGITLVKGRLLTKDSVWDLHQFVRNQPGDSRHCGTAGNVFKQLQDSVEGRGTDQGNAGTALSCRRRLHDSSIQCGSEKLEDYEEKNGGTNITRGQDFPKTFGVFSFVFDIPVNTKTFYMRTKVHGSSIFSGTSAVWKIDVDHGAPESSVSGESGGDRGATDCRTRGRRRRRIRGVKATPGIRKIPLGIRIKILSQIKSLRRAKM